MAHRGGSFPRELVEAPKKIPVDKLRLKTDVRNYFIIFWLKDFILVSAI